jgi:prevent-host-death family protein
MDIVDIGAFEAKTRLSELLEQVGRGRVYRITKRGKPIAELRPIAAPVTRPVFGEDRGRVKIGPDFEAPLEDFEGYR